MSLCYLIFNDMQAVYIFYKFYAVNSIHACNVC
jgi:hypothetical protein